MVTLYPYWPLIAILFLSLPTCIGIGLLYFDKEYNKSWNKIFEEAKAEPFHFFYTCHQYGAWAGLYFIIGLAIFGFCIGMLALTGREIYWMIFGYPAHLQ